MNRRAAVTVVLVACLAAAGGYVFIRSRSGTVSTPQLSSTKAPQTPTPGGPTPLPNFFESPGLVSRRAGPLRLYVALAREISLHKPDADGAQFPGQTLARVPIVVVLENDTYKKVNFGSDLALTGEDLFTLQISDENQTGGEVFSYRESRADLSGWDPAERKTFTVDWPARGVSAGSYIVSVTPAFGKQEPLRIHTTLR